MPSNVAQTAATGSVEEVKALAAKKNGAGVAAGIHIASVAFATMLGMLFV